MRASTARGAGRPPGARSGRLSGAVLAGASFEDGTLLFAARWDAAPGGPFASVLRREMDGRRILVVDTEPGERIAGLLHEADELVRGPIEWTSMSQRSTIRWSEGGEARRLVFRHASHLGFLLASAVLGRLPDRLLLSPRLTRIVARLFGPALGVGPGPFAGKTETGVPIQFLVRHMEPILQTRLFRGKSSSGPLTAASGARLGDLSVPRRPVILQGELWYVPPER